MKRIVLLSFVFATCLNTSFIQAHNEKSTSRAKFAAITTFKIASATLKTGVGLVALAYAIAIPIIATQELSKVKSLTMNGVIYKELDHSTQVIASCNDVNLLPAAAIVIGGVSATCGFISFHAFKSAWNDIKSIWNNNNSSNV